MASAREMRLRIKSVKNISQVTRALEAVSAAKVRKAIQALTATRSYASKAWQVMTHITNQPGSLNLHPLLTARSSLRNALVIVMTADRGLAGARRQLLLWLARRPRRACCGCWPFVRCAPDRGGPSPRTVRGSARHGTAAPAGPASDTRSELDKLFGKG